MGLAATIGGLVSQTRNTTATYDAKGQFATSIANALSESEQWTYNSNYGTPASHTGPNGIPTSWTYDMFGRVTKELRPDGTSTAYSYVYCSGVNGGVAACPANGAYLVQATPLAPDGMTPNGPAVIAYYDSLSRAIATDTASFDTSPAPWIRAETHFDKLGRVAVQSRPYFLGVDTPVWTTSGYVVNIPRRHGGSRSAGPHLALDCAGREHDYIQVRRSDFDRGPTRSITRQRRSRTRKASSRKPSIPTTRSAPSLTTHSGT
ncbi:MAG: RHS repeat domain-containing protein [Rhizomicrobium sp.]